MTVWPQRPNRDPFDTRPPRRARPLPRQLTAIGGFVGRPCTAREALKPFHPAQPQAPLGEDHTFRPPGSNTRGGNSEARASSGFCCSRPRCAPTSAPVLRSYPRRNVAAVVLAVDALTWWTGVLAGATVVLGFGTFCLGYYARKSAEAEAMALERSHRPVLMPYKSVSRVPADGHAPEIWGDTFMVPIVNVGMGPALDVVGEIEFRDAEGEVSTSGIAGPLAAGLTVIANDGRCVALGFSDHRLSGRTGFQIELRYRDVAGVRWKTTAIWSEQRRTYRDQGIDRTGAS